MVGSKNRQSDAKIRELAKHAFPEKTVAEIAELDVGTCNALYMLRFEDGAKMVLKVASPGMQGMMSNEQWLMETETCAMRMVNEKLPSVCAPKLLFYDDSLTLCSGKYFFMEFVDGVCMRDLKGNMDDAQAKSLYNEVGRYVRAIGSVKHEKFGIVNSGIEFDSLFGLVRLLVENTVGDLERKNADFAVDGDVIRAQLMADRAIFDEVKQPALVHFDVWENNIIVRDGRIAGLLDWERALWGEMLMEERFREYAINLWFYEGFGQTEFTVNERRRMKWYDIWMDLSMMCEQFYRAYDDDSQYLRARGRMVRHWQELTGK